MMGCAALVHAWALCHLPHRGPSAPERLGPHPLAYFLILRRIKLEWWDASRVMDPVHRPPQDLGSRPRRVPVGCFGRMCISQHAPHGPTPLGKIHLGQNSAEARPAREALLHAPTSLVLEVLRIVGYRCVCQSRQRQGLRMFCVSFPLSNHLRRGKSFLNATNISSSCGTPAAGL
jgi:hypothetical protein